MTTKKKQKLAEFIASHPNEWNVILKLMRLLRCGVISSATPNHIVASLISEDIEQGENGEITI